MRRKRRLTTMLAAALLVGGCVSSSQAEGLAVARAAGCLSCHTETNTSVAPTWVDLWGSQVELEDGSLIIADEQYIRESIVDPQARIVEGYGATMPLLSLTAEEVGLLVTYIRSLS